MGFGMDHPSPILTHPNGNLLVGTGFGDSILEFDFSTGDLVRTFTTEVDFATFAIVIPAPCPWDLNGDGFVGIGDLLALFAVWGPCPGPPGCPGDFNADGFVGVGDLLAMFANQGPCP